jgi:metallo-beta-lactamase class B
MGEAEKYLKTAGASLLLLMLAAGAPAPNKGTNEPVPPLKIADGLYYVGSNEVSSFLIDSGSGLILIDGGYRETAPQILANVRSLGYDPRQIRYLLNSQAHFDHAGGLAEIKAATGARMLASVADAEMLERGGRWDFFWGNDVEFPAVRVDEAVQDGRKLRLGKVVLTAHLTPGHTPGCTSWTMPVMDRGKSYTALFNCSTTVPGYKLLGNLRYPQLASDYQATFRKLEALPCDIFLGSHASFFRLEEKRKALANNPSRNPFIDPEGCARHLQVTKLAFEKQLAQERAALDSKAVKPAAQ